MDGITIRPTVNESSATVEYLDSSDTEIADSDSGKTGQQVSLDVGANTIKVKVTAEDTTTTNPYTVVVTRAADTTPPEVVSVTVPISGSEVELIFDEDLDETVVGTLLVSVFSLTVAGQAVTIRDYEIRAMSLALYMQASTIKQGQTVVLSYTDPTAADDTVALQDIAGNDVASFTTGQSGVPAVTNDSTNTAPTGAPTITGTAQVGQTLTAVTTGIADANGLTNPTYTYQWIRANGTEADIASANSSTYILVAADLGKTIKVKVRFEDDDGNAETLTSAATATVVAAPTAPMVNDVDVTSTPDSADTYGTGEMIQFTVTFDQAVTVTGTPEFEFCLGSSATVSCTVGMPPPALRSAALLSGSGTTALVFSYTVLVGDVDENGIYAGNQNDTIKLDGGDTIQGTVGGLTAVLTHAEEGEHTGHKVNGAAANTAPTAANNTVTTAEDRAYTFTAADFGFMDADTGAALASVKIVTVPGAGTLALDGTAVMAADVVTKAQIDGDMLTFRPARDADGVAYTTFTFKVNDGTDDSASAYTMTIDVTDAPAPVCTAPSFGDRREIWTGTVTVETLILFSRVRLHGFDALSTFGVNAGALDPPTFNIGSNAYTVNQAFVYPAGDLDGDLQFTLNDSLSDAKHDALRLHVCDTPFDFSAGSPIAGAYRWTADLDWSHPVVTRTLYLSLPANNVATGEPAISGTAQVGQELTADASPIADDDGLTDVDFTYQWLRVDADGTSNEEDITGEIAATYTLATDDEGKKIKVQVSFTDELSGVEMRTSAAYPSSGTVTTAGTNTAPMVTDVDVTSTPDSGDTYGIGEMILFTVTFDQNVTVVGTPEFEFCLGSSSTMSCSAGMPPPALRSAAYVSGSGTTMLVFSYTVVAGDMDDNGIWIGNQADTLKLDAADTIQGTMGGLTAVLTHAEEGPQTGHKVDGGAPTVPPDPTPPTLVLATATTLTIEWTHPGDGGSPLTRNFIEYRVDGTTAWTNWYRGETPTPVTRTVIRNLAAATAYDVRVHSTNAIGNSQWVQSATAFSTLANNAATGAPSITGTATVGQELTASTTGIDDDDGLPSSFTYQWVRVDADGTSNPVDITDATAATYTLTADDEGKKVKVKVSFTDDLDSTETRTSAAYPSSGTVTTNTAPTGADNTVTTGVGTAYAFTADDFGFADDDAGDTLASVKIVTVPDEGTLALAGTDVTLNDVVTKAQIDGEMLTFTPVAGASGTGYASFTFKVSDGTADSASAYTMTIDVTAAGTNTAPTAANNTVTTAEDRAYTFEADDFRFMDADPGDTLAIVKIWSSQWRGTLALDGVAINWYAVVTKAQIDGKMLTFTPARDAHRDHYGSFRFKVNDGTDDSTFYGMRIDVTDTPAPVCGVPSFGDRRNIWTGTVTVGTYRFGGSPLDFYGYKSSAPPSGDLDDQTFTIGSNDYTIVLARVALGGSNSGELLFEMETGQKLTTVEVAALRLHVCDTTVYNFSDATNSRLNSYGWSGSLDWSHPVVTRTVYLSLPANNAATGEPAITGTATVGQELTATTGTIADDDGLPSSFTYQWVRVDADGTSNPADITDANAATYTLTDDAGKKIKVKVSFTDELSGVEMRTSAAYPSSGTVTAAAGTPTGAPTITGTAQVGETLTAVTTGIADADGLTSPTYTYQWIRVNGTDADISGANSSTYPLVTADLGKTIKVRVTFDDDDGNTEMLTSASYPSSGTVTMDVTLPSLSSATVQGMVLTLVYDEPLDPASTPAPRVYILTVKATVGTTTTNTETNPAAVSVSGSRVRLTLDTAPAAGARVTLLYLVFVVNPVQDVAGNDALPFGVHVMRGNPPPTTNTPPVVAIPLADQEVTVDVPFTYVVPADAFTDADGNPLTYTAALSDGGMLPSWLTFDPATRTFTGTPTAADVGTVSVKVTASDGNGGSVSDTFDIVVSPPADTTAPRVASIVRGTPSSSPTNADSLTWRVTFSEAVSNVDTADFAVSGTTATLSVSAVSGVTGAYDVTASGGNLAGVTAMVTLSIATGHTIQDAASNALTNTTPTGANDNTYVVDNTAPTVTITGVPGTSSAAFTATFTFSEDVTGFVAGDITVGNGTASAFTATTADRVYTASITPTANGAVTVDVAADVATDAAGNGNTAATQASSTYTASSANNAATGAPTITGTAQVGQTLTAGTTAIMDADGLTSVSYTYQWIRVATDNTETNISSATASTYMLVAADLGTTLKVRVSFTDDANNPETLTSAATATVSAATVTLSGAGATWSLVGENTVAAGQTYTYTLTRTSGSLPFNEYFGFTSDTLRTDRFKDGTSDCTGTNYFCFTLSNSGRHYEEYTVSGVRFAGRKLEDTSPHVLTLNVATGTPTGTTVTLGLVDQYGGARSGGLQITVGTATTDTAATGAPTITGTAQVGQTLTAGTTAIMDADGLTSVSYTYQWIRVATDNTETNISSATASTYMLVAADLGTTLKVRVSFTDDANNPETLTSAATATVTLSGAGATWSLVGENTVAAGQTYTYTLTRTSGSLPFNEYFGFTSDTLRTDRFKDGTSDCTGTNYFCFTLSNSGRHYEEYTVSGVRFAGRKLEDTSPHVLTLNVATGTPTGTTVTLGLVDQYGGARSGGLQITVGTATTNTAATGAPTITGTAQVGQTLTASTTGIADADGLTSVSYTYQWIRVATDNTETNISSATASTYMLVAADLGTTLKVRVSFTDDASNTETLTSAAYPSSGTVRTTDVVPPSLSSATVQGMVLTLVYDEPLDPASTPPPVAYILTVKATVGTTTTNTTTYPAAVSVSGNRVRLTLDTAPAAGVVTVTLIYVGSVVNPVQDVAGNDALPFGVHVMRGNPPPTTNTPPTADHNTVTTAEDRAYTFTAADFGFADTDAGDTLASVKIVTVPDEGTLALAGTAVAANAVVTTAQIDGDMLIFTPVAGASGDAYTTFTFKVSDGTDDSASAYTMTIDVTAAPNTAPTAVHNTVTTAEDTAYAFTADDFGFADMDAGDTLASVKIVTLPAVGTLAHDGTAVLVDAVVTKADIDDNKLTFTPVAGASGTGYASFTFKVNDGTVDSASAYTMTIDVAVLPAITIVAGRSTRRLGNMDWIRYTLSREGDTAAELTVTVTFAGSSGNDWSLDPTNKAMREVTFAADSAAAEQNILLAGGFYGIGFSDSATTSGTLTARLGAKTGYDTSDTDEVAVVVTSGPAWVIKLTADAYRFDEDGGGQNIELVATAASAAIPAPSLDRVNKSALHIGINTTGGTAEAYVDVDDPGDYQNIAETLYFPPSTCTADPNADNVLVCRSNATFTPVDDTEAEPDETLNFNLAKVTGSSPAIHIQGPGPDRTVSTSSKTYPATIVDDDFGVTGVAVTSTPQQATDTYGAWEHIELSVSFNKPVTVTGAPTFSFDLGGTTTTAAYQGGSGTGTLVFSYQVMPDDADSNGIAWAADALAGGTIVEMGGTATPTLTVAVQGALSDHKVDGTQTASGTATVSTVAVTSTPLLMASGSTSADTYGVGETIEFTVTFSEAVTVTGDPQFAFSMSNPPDRLADYDQAASTATALVFRYTVQAADQDTDGIWVGDQSRTLKLDPDDRILTMSNSLPASLTHGEEGTKGSHKVDGSRGTSSTSAPGAPGDLRPAPGDGRVTLAWTAPANTGGAAILKYQYRARRTGTAAWTPDWTDVPDGSDSGSSAADETRVTVSGLTNGTEYRFEVRAVNSIGGGTAAWKNDTPVAAPAQAPGRPRSLLAASGNAQVTLTWAAPLDDGGAAISRYEYRHAQGTSVPASVLWQPAGLNFRQTVTGLVNDRQYTFEVRAANSAGEGPPATIQARPTASANAPSAPRFLKAVTTDRQVMLSWFAPARDGGSSITEYQYRHASGTSVPDDTPWSSAGRRLHAGSGSLTNGQRYTFQVRAVAAVAGPAASVTATPSANPVRRLPGAVSGLTATAGAYGDERRRRQYGRVTLNWNPPAVDDNSVLERFEYRYADSDSALPARWLQGSSNTTNVTIDRLKVVTDYVFEVRAVNLEGPGPAVRRSIRTPPAPEVGMSLAASRRTAIEGEALTFEVRRANRLENPAAFVLVGVTDSAFPGISALGGPVGGDGAGVRIVKFQPDATSATGTVRVEFDGARPSTRTLTITLQGINSPDYFGTPVRLDITVTDRDAGLRVRDARVREGPGAILAFSVTLDRRRDREVAVNYATSDGTATQGDDYTRTTGTLVFSAGETSKTVSVPVVDDAHNEGSETLTLTLSNARGAVIDDGTAVGTIVNSDPMPDAWLSRFGRAASDQVVQAIGRRLEGAARESHLTVMGWRADTLFDSRRAGRVSGEEPGHEAALESPRFGRDGAELRAGGTPGAPGGFMAQGAPGAGAFQMTEGAPDALRGAPGVVPVAVQAPGAVHAPGARGRGGPWADMLRGLLMKVGAGWDVRVPGLRDMVKGSSFYYGYSSDAGPLRGMNRLTAWGEGASTRFSGAEGKLSLDGEVNTAIVGADGEWGRWLAGVALSYSEGEGDYRQNSAKGSAVSSTLTGVNPYARYRLDERTSLWGTFGYGRGRLTLTPKEAESSLETDMTNVMAAFGGRSVLSMRTGETGQFELALRSDAMLTDTTSAAVTGLAAGEGATNRIRLILEGSGSLPAFGGVLAPKVEAGLRYDGGDAETGAGLEVGGGLAYDMRRLTVKVDGRVLLTHQDRDYEEWGYSLSFLYQPAKNGRGLRLEGGSQWGVAQSGVHNLWSLQNAGGLASGAHTANEQRYTAELGYGFGVRRLWYPYIATESGGASSRSLRFGLKLNAGSDLEAGLEIGRRAHAFGRIENDIRLQLRARW